MNMILVDTSVWIEYIRNKQGVAGDVVAQLIKNRSACINGVVLVEILTGARNADEFKEIKEALEPLPILQITEPVWWKAGEYRYLMKKEGFTTGLPDTVIATTAVHYDVELFSLDEHFLEIAKFIPLKLFNP